MSKETLTVNDILAGIEDPIVRGVLAGLLGAGAGGNTQSKTGSKNRTIVQLTYTSAKELLTQQARIAGTGAAIGEDEITAFMNEFNAKAIAQAASSVETVRKSTKVGKTDEDLVNSAIEDITTNYPSFFDTDDFAKRYVWKNLVKFSNPKTAGGKALNAFQQVQAQVRGMGQGLLSTADMETFARKIAMGDLSIDEFSATLRAQAIKDYPHFADRLSMAAPGTTMRDLAMPVINVIANTLEMDPNSIDLDYDLLETALRPDGTAGKVPPLSLSDVKRLAMKSKAFEGTIQANEWARDGAVTLGAAMGMGFN